jgi:homocysteine S-methyltransferase
MVDSFINYRLEAMSTPDPVQTFLEDQGFLVVDGGLATELEFAGHHLGDSLWSARLLAEAPDAIAQVHRDYLDAGADCIVSASYQATVPGFVRRGLSESGAEGLIRTAVHLAVQERDRFWSSEDNRAGRRKPLVAAGVGPYGAYLANGAEFTGDYDLDEEGLVGFHRKRWQILAATEADLLACETVPSFTESVALARLLSETPGARAWLSFSCRDSEHISDGTPIVQCVEALDENPQVLAVGVNCTAPSHISGLVEAVRSVTSKPIVVYPNSGEIYDAERKCWTGTADPDDFAGASLRWFDAGAGLLGGCCRTRPETIRRLRQALMGR